MERFGLRVFSCLENGVGKDLIDDQMYPELHLSTRAQLPAPFTHRLGQLDVCLDSLSRIAPRYWIMGVAEDQTSDRHPLETARFDAVFQEWDDVWGKGVDVGWDSCKDWDRTSWIGDIAHVVVLALSVPPQYDAYGSTAARQL